MKTDLDHLPSAKQRELERIIAAIFEEFEAALVNATGEWKKRGRIEKIILYGSYARGTWVDEPHTAKGYQSDYDLLIVVNDKRLTDRAAYWLKLEDRLDRDFGITKTLHTPVNFIIHSLQEVNDGLAHGRYFFMDIRQDGVVLYQYDRSALYPPKPKTPAEAYAMAQEYFDEWFPAAMRKFEFVQFGLDKGHFKETAFELHQTTESLYHCVLLVMTSYTPHVHNLKFLRTQAERLDARLVDVWPRELHTDRARFEKLKEAYVKARYSKHYKISEDELRWLGSHVETLGQVVHTICSERLQALSEKAAATG